MTLSHTKQGAGLDSSFGIPLMQLKGGEASGSELQATNQQEHILRPFYVSTSIFHLGEVEGESDCRCKWKKPSICHVSACCPTVILHNLQEANGINQETLITKGSADTESPKKSDEN